MSIEREYVGEFACDSIQDLVDSSYLNPGVEADSILLKGYAMPEDIKFHEFIALSHLVGDGVVGRIKFNVITEELNNVEKLYNNVLDLNIPEKIGENYKEIDTDRDIYAVSKSYLTSKDMPYVAIGFGKVMDTGKEAAVLFFAMGVAPKDALSEVQRAVSDHKLQLNLFLPREPGVSLTRFRAANVVFGDVRPSASLNQHTTDKIKALYCSAREIATLRTNESEMN